MVTLHKATPLMAFAAQVADKISDRDGRIRCLRASFSDLNEARAINLLKCLKEEHDRCRMLGSRDQPRVDRIIDVPPPASSVSRQKLPQVPVFTVKDMEARAAQVGQEVAKGCKHAFQIALNANAAVHMYVARRAFTNVCAQQPHFGRCFVHFPRGTKSNGKIRIEHAVNKALTNAVNKNLPEQLKALGFAVPTAAGLDSRTRHTLKRLFL